MRNGKKKRNMRNGRKKRNMTNTSKRKKRHVISGGIGRKSWKRNSRNRNE